MNETADREPAKSSWPPKLMGAGIAMGAVLLIGLAPSLDGYVRNLVRLSIGGTVLAMCLTRWAIAHWRKEQSRGWIVYLAIALLSPLASYSVELILDALGKW